MILLSLNGTDQKVASQVQLSADDLNP